MAGIDSMIRQIEDDTKAVCDEMISKAQDEKEAILADARQQADAFSAAQTAKTQSRVKDIQSRAVSSAQLEERKIALKNKQRIISDMLNAGLAAAKNLPDDEYFALILNMIENNSQPADGEIRFSKKDLSRLPKGFIETANSVSKGKLTLSDSAAAIDAGFVLTYGGIEENCSFDAIFLSRAETLSDQASSLLF